MSALHPTDLTLGVEYCWRALDFREQRVPYDRSVFAAGIASHAVLEAVGRNYGHNAEAVAREVVARLAGEGRSWDGTPEPPLPVERVLEGRDLALAWVADHPMPMEARYELGIAVTSDWQPTDYFGADAAYRTILDRIEVLDEEDEESALRVCVVTDYKTSWRDRENALDSLQRRAQAVLANASGLADGCDVLRLEVVNLRIRQTYARDIDLVADTATLAAWRSDLAVAAEAAGRRGPDGRRAATPGVNCIGCPYRLRCDAAHDFWMETGVPGSAEALAHLYATKLAEVRELEQIIRAALARDVAIETDQGRVGYIQASRRALRDGAHGTLYDDWLAGGGEPRGLLAALSLSVRSVEAAGKVLIGKGRGAAALRREWLDKLTTTVRTARFGVTWRKDEPGEAWDPEGGGA